MFVISKTRLLLVSTAIFAVSLTVGVLIGFFSAPKKSKGTPNENSYYEQIIQVEDASFGKVLIETINKENIKMHLKNMTSRPHMAGLPGDLSSAQYVHDTWLKQGLINVKLVKYDVFLSFPDQQKPNSIAFNAGPIINITETLYDPELANPDIPLPFLAFSPNGSFTSQKVYYANYGTLDDFKYLVNAKKFDLKDAIVIVRYGQIFRGNKVKLAAQYGAKGVLIFDDPVRAAPNDVKGQTYPNGEFLPGDGMQRGTLYTGSGDPLTPMYPATESAYRISEKDSEELPNIVAQVIGYDVAKLVLEKLSGDEVTNEAWKGGIDGITYRYGGPLNNGENLTINVNNYRDRRSTYNVVGVIEGETEPDRYVIIGNHRDAWVFGAIDPTSGTACLLEITRALQELKVNKNWKPKRSLVFFSWGAEEYGLMGSTELVEEFNKKLNIHAVAYLNLDVAVQGNYTYSASASPLLFDLIYDVAKLIKINDTASVYQRMLEYENKSPNDSPTINTQLGSGSDHMGFQQRVGLSCIDNTFKQDTRASRYKLLGASYATYHSSYETYRLIEKFIDQEFNSFKIITNIVAELARRLSDSLILPFNMRRYTDEMNIMIKDLRAEYGNDLSAQGISLDGLSAAIANYSSAALQFHNRLNKIDKTHVYEIRQYNDQMKNLEKAFLDYEGINRKGFLHMLSAPSLYNQYGGDGFPALSDSIYNALQDPTNVQLWEIVKKQLSIVIYVIQSATSVLNEPSNFERYFF